MAAPFLRTVTPDQRAGNGREQPSNVPSDDVDAHRSESRTAQWVRRVPAAFGRRVDDAELPRDDSSFVRIRQQSGSAAKDARRQ
jgi:hypothetical protein